MSEERQTFVLFELAGATYAVPSAKVQHIEMLEQVTIVPNAHRAIDGVVFSRGQVIPALNLRVRFGFPRQESTLRTRIVFVQLAQRIVGLVVDSAREFKNIPTTGIRPIERELTGIAGKFLTGLTTVKESTKDSVKDRLILILDLDAVLNLEKDESLANSLSELIANSAPELEEAPAKL